MVKLLWDSPGCSFGSRYCQKKHPVITIDNSRKKTRARWENFTFILLLLVTSSVLTATAASATAGVGFTNRKKTKQSRFIRTECLMDFLSVYKEKLWRRVTLNKSKDLADSSKVFNKRTYSTKSSLN